MSTISLAKPSPQLSRLKFRLRGLIITGLPLLMGALVAAPLVLLLINSFNVALPGRPADYGLSNWTRALADPVTMSSLWTSVSLGAVRTIITLPFAVLVAWLIARTNMPGRSAIEMLCWLAIFLPLLPLTFGWILLLE